VFRGVVGVLWICLEGDLCRTKGALDVETEYFDAVVVLPLDRFFASIELLALVNVFPAGIASQPAESSLAASDEE